VAIEATKAQILAVASHLARQSTRNFHWESNNMAEKLKVGDHVTWNSEAGYVSGRIIKIHKKDVKYRGYTHHATENDPQYEIKSDKTEHVAMHKGSALKKKG
jgi:hypothetical protein